MTDYGSYPTDTLPVGEKRIVFLAFIMIDMHVVRGCMFASPSHALAITSLWAVVLVSVSATTELCLSSGTSTSRFHLLRDQTGTMVATYWTAYGTRSPFREMQRRRSASPPDTTQLDSWRLGNLSNTAHKQVGMPSWSKAGVL